jgi:hypothetical protein
MGIVRLAEAERPSYLAFARPGRQIGRNRRTGHGFQHQSRSFAMTYTDDPDLDVPEIVHWYPPARRSPIETGGAGALGLVALGATAVGAMAVGALAIGALVIGKLAVRNAHFKTLTIDELTVRKLQILEP